ncbi:SLATT domain-containing protein [Duganella sp. LX20W]|uniref:SLATT domain-containing protein n=1 Tax=Rugamonas brunnea TaxID=2758569 RepID=A0A7W2EX98_9BURK|nr:SLATT domain-containing protein [Rugamonas brunnea]MBA5640292.1 SLATT domain-containing protein [Rugamonas brunnea]
MSNIVDSAKTLGDKIWFSREAWARAESRLLSNQGHAQRLLVVYSVYSLCFAIALLKYKVVSDDFQNIFSVVLAVMLMALSLHLNTRNFRDRAQQFKSGYLKLMDIESRIMQVALQRTPQAMLDDYNDLVASYKQLLNDVENHTTGDALLARYRAGAERGGAALTVLERSHVFLLQAWRALWLAVFYLGPVLALAVCYVGIRNNLF